MVYVLGFLAADAIFDPSVSLAQKFLETDYIGALLTCFRAYPPSGFATMLATYLLRAGTPLGEVALALNLAGPWRPSWVLLGDPAAHLPFAPAQEHSMRGEPTRRSARVEPGLFSIRIDPQAATVTAVPKDGGDLNDRNFALRPMRGVGMAIGALLTEQARDIEFQLWGKAGPPPPLTTLRSMWSSSSDLAFSRRFFELARHNPKLAKLHHDDQLQEAITQRIARDLSAASVTDLDGVMSGPYAALRREADREVRDWTSLNERLYAALYRFAHSVGGVLDRTYGEGCLRRPAGHFELCPYCGSSLDADIVTVPLIGSERITFMCPRCTIISDVPSRFWRISIAGPERIPLGQDINFRLELQGLPSAGWIYVVSGLTLGGEIPWETRINSPARSAVINAGDSSVNVQLTVRFPEDTPPGRYFLLAPTVIHGAITMARRPVILGL